jgi:hypothetical protein
LQKFFKRLQIPTPFNKKALDETNIVSLKIRPIIIRSQLSFGTSLGGQFD